MHMKWKESCLFIYTIKWLLYILKQEVFFVYYHYMAVWLSVWLWYYMAITMRNYGTKYTSITWNSLFHIWFTVFLNLWLSWLLNFCYFQTLAIPLQSVAAGGSWL